MRSAERLFVPGQESFETLLSGLLTKEERVANVTGTNEDARRGQIFIGLGELFARFPGMGFTGRHRAPSPRAPRLRAGMP